MFLLPDSVILGRNSEPAEAVSRSLCWRGLVFARLAVQVVPAGYLALANLNPWAYLKSQAEKLARLFFQPWPAANPKFVMTDLCFCQSF